MKKRSLVLRVMNYQRLLAAALSLALGFGLAGCRNKNVQNPIAAVNSKQPDKVLFDRAMDAMKRNRFDVARMTLQTLINTYPDSEYVARAKLAIGDAWYAEGGSAALAQAEAEYKDFKTFFPTMPEAAEAQLKIGNIEYQQMEKFDRDFTHARRAEDEYRQVILQYPDSKLAAQAKERLRQVQEVLAEREFAIGHFYYLRESYAAAIARLKSVSDAYPLFSEADEALYLLGTSYEKQAARVRALPERMMRSDMKERAVADADTRAADAYARLITRYPLSSRADEARRRLTALHFPVPTPTPDAIAQNKAERAERHNPGMMGRVRDNFRKAPDTSMAAKTGEPTLVDAKETGAPDVIRASNAAALGFNKSAAGENKVSVEPVRTGTPPPNQPVPRSDTQPSAAGGIPELVPSEQGAPPESKDMQPPLPAPPQLNQAAQPESAGQPAAAAASSSGSTAPGNSESSSKHKKKKKKDQAQDKGQSQKPTQ
jgi:outer membrane protein assembly factor BamD